MQLLRSKKKDDQAGKLRMLAADNGASAERPPIVVVLGAKGGVGTTTLAWRISQSLAATGVNPLAVDAHLWQPDLARVAGQASQAGETLADVLAGKTAPSDAVRIDDGPALLPGSWSDPSASTHGDLGGLITDRVAPDLHERFDTLIIDGGPGRTPWADSLTAAADLMLLVTTPGELSLLGAYSLIKQASAANSPPEIRLIVNRCENETHGRETHSRIRDACRQHLNATVTLAGWLPPDIRIPNRDKPPVPLIRPIARRIREALDIQPAAPDANKAAA